MRSQRIHLKREQIEISFEGVDRSYLYENGEHGGAVSVAGEEVEQPDENRLRFGTYFQ